MRKKSILELKEAKVQLLKTFLIKGVQLARMLIYDADQSKPDWTNGGKFEYSEEERSAFAVFTIFATRLDPEEKLKEFLDIPNGQVLKILRDEILPNMDGYEKGIPALSALNNPMFFDYECAIILKDLCLPLFNLVTFKSNNQIQHLQSLRARTIELKSIIEKTKI